MTAISLIIPVYQSKEYLEACLDSLVNQDFKYPYQIILVETASPDGSDEICKRYQQKYPELVYHFHYDKAYSISMARNLGIQHSSGEYVFFMDGDDVLRSNALTTLYSYKNKDCEIIAGSYSLLTSKGEQPVKNILEGKREGREALHKLFHNKTFCGFCWNHLFLRSFLLKNHIYFENNVTIYEDLLFMMEAYYRCDIVFFAKEDTYLYRQREDSTLSSCPDLLLHHILVLDNLKHKLRYDKHTRHQLFFHCPRGLKKQFQQDQKRSNNKDKHQKEIKALFQKEKE